MTFLEDMTIDELLEEIIQKKGAYSRDHLIHAENCIDNASKCAKRIKDLLGAKKGEQK